MKIPFFAQRRTVLKRIVQYSILGLFALSTPLAGSLLQNTQAQTKPGFTSKIINLAYQTSGDIVKVKKVVEPRFKALGVTGDVFIQGKVDVWVASDPFLALVEKIIPIRNLRNAAGINTLGGFYLGRRKFVTENPELVRVFLEEADKIGEWADKNPKEVAQAFAPELKLEVSVLEKVSRRTTRRLRKLTPSIIAEQQRVADFYFEEKIIPRKINIKDALLSPQLYEAITPKRLN